MGILRMFRNSIVPVGDRVADAPTRRCVGGGRRLHLDRITKAFERMPIVIFPGPGTPPYLTGREPQQHRAAPLDHVADSHQHLELLARRDVHLGARAELDHAQLRACPNLLTRL